MRGLIADPLQLHPNVFGLNVMVPPLIATSELPQKDSAVADQRTVMFPVDGPVPRSTLANPNFPPVNELAMLTIAFCTVSSVTESIAAPASSIVRI